jgi:2-polyprenyl-3-methyl-5-hydroxy-6-metoxy-1,4-benzoquinol methylase
MPADLLTYTQARIQELDPNYATAIARVIDNMEPAMRRRAEDFLAAFAAFMQATGRTFDFGIERHVRMRETMVEERLYFVRNGDYSNKSFDDVNRRVYANPEIMTTHMYGLVFAQFLWLDQVDRFRFFCETLPSYASAVAKYLEVGGGHALYIREALDALPAATFDLVDISASSIDLARAMCPPGRVHFHLCDIFDFPGESQYDFVTMGEVIEHVEDPLSLLVRVRNLLKPGGSAYITTPANAPMVDHIYLFHNEREIRDLLQQAGFVIEHERMRFAEDIPEEKARKRKLPLMYAAFVRPAVALS